MEDSLTCRKCIETKPLEAFTTSAKSKNGKINLCKECGRLAAKNYYKRNRGKKIEYSKKYSKTSKGYSVRLKYLNSAREIINKRVRENTTTEQRAAIRRKQNELYPQKYKARSVLRTALCRGIIQKEPCCICGSTKAIEAHHTDYNKPIDVMWMCRSHHRAWHRVFAPENSESLATEFNNSSEGKES